MQVVATWCQKDSETFSEEEKKTLQFLYDEWAHPYFISKEEYARIMNNLGTLSNVKSENWVEETINSWRHSIWVCTSNDTKFSTLHVTLFRFAWF